MLYEEVKEILFTGDFLFYQKQTFVIPLCILLKKQRLR